jgi:hypothetical protein
MDEDKLNQLGIRPLTGELNRIRALKDKKGLPLLIAHLTQIGVSTPYGMYVRQDARESTKYAVYLTQSGLGLPDRDYYLKKDDAKMASALAKYELHVGKILTWPATATATPTPRKSSRWKPRWPKCNGPRCRTAIRSSATTRWTSSSWPSWRRASTGAMRWPPAASPTRSAT